MLKKTALFLQDGFPKGSQEQSFFLQKLLFSAFLVTVLKILTYALVST